MCNFVTAIQYSSTVTQNWAAIPSSGLRLSEDIVPQFFIMMTALTDTSSPELPQWLYLNSESKIPIISDIYKTRDCYRDHWVSCTVYFRTVEMYVQIVGCQPLSLILRHYSRPLLIRTRLDQLWSNFRTLWL